MKAGNNSEDLLTYAHTDTKRMRILQWDTTTTLWESGEDTLVSVRHCPGAPICFYSQQSRRSMSRTMMDVTACAGSCMLHCFQLPLGEHIYCTSNYSTDHRLDKVLWQNGLVLNAMVEMLALYHSVFPSWEGLKVSISAMFPRERNGTTHGLKISSNYFMILMITKPSYTSANECYHGSPGMTLWINTQLIVEAWTGQSRYQNQNKPRNSSRIITDSSRFLMWYMLTLGRSSGRSKFLLQIYLRNVHSRSPTMRSELRLLHHHIQYEHSVIHVILMSWCCQAFPEFSSRAGKKSKGQCTFPPHADGTIVLHNSKVLLCLWQTSW